MILTPASGYVNLKNSKDFSNFGNQKLAVTGEKSGIDWRIFSDIPADVIVSHRKKIGGCKTVEGISKTYEIIVFPSRAVYFRKVPCFCSFCLNLQWNMCQMKSLIGSPRLVVKPDKELRKNAL